MNIVGILVPKLVTLVTILVPPIDTGDKIVLVLIWFVKLLIDYDAVRPGHSGNIYKLTKGVSFEVGELMVAIVQFIPAAIFLLTVMLMKAWIPFIPGVIAALVCLSSVICCINNVISEGKSR